MTLESWDNTGVPDRRGNIRDSGFAAGTRKLSSIFGQFFSVGPGKKSAFEMRKHYKFRKFANENRGFSGFLDIFGFFRIFRFFQIFSIFSIFSGGRGIFFENSRDADCCVLVLDWMRFIDYIDFWVFILQQKKAAAAVPEIQKTAFFQKKRILRRTKKREKNAKKRHFWAKNGIFRQKTAFFRDFSTFLKIPDFSWFLIGHPLAQPSPDFPQVGGGSILIYIYYIYILYIYYI